jgi:O-antigen/teichoic acid export membrane protein|tara:strand:- start:466 stop:1887 length:1422 start_codon:yes stop_codon:yes gene_type:complete
MKNKRNSLLWSFIDNFSQQIVNFIVGVILARLLLPSDFSVIGVIMVFIAISNVFVNFGFNDAIINKKKVTQLDYSTVFWANIILGLLVYIILYFSSPFVELFFDMYNLSYYIRLTGLSIIFSSFSSIHRAKLSRELDFKTISVVSLYAVVISGASAIYMAYNGHGVISLVLRMTLGQFLTLLFFVIFNKWFPQIKFNFKLLKEIAGFSSNLFLSRLLNVLYNNVYYFVVGKIYLQDTLGFYTRAENYKNILSLNIATAIQRVSFSELSRYENKIQREESFLKFISITIVLSFLSMLVLNICSHEIIIITVGLKWLPSVLLLKIMTLSGFFSPLYFINLNYFAIIGNTKKLLQIEFLTKFFVIPVIFIGLYTNIECMLFSIVGLNLLNLVVILITLKKMTLIIVATQIKLIGKAFSYSLVIFAIYYLILGDKVYYNVTVSLFLKVISITIIFLSCYFVFQKKEILNLVKIYTTK